MTELRNKRKRFEKVLDNGDGTFTSQVAAGPIHYYNWNNRGDGEGGWREIDLIPVQQQNGSWKVDFHSYSVTIPQLATGSLSYTDLYSDGIVHKNRELTIDPYCYEVTGTYYSDLRGCPAIVYTDAFGEGSDLIYQIRRTGLSKWVRVRSGFTAQTNYVFDLYVPPNSTIARLGDGGYVINPNLGPKVLDKNRYTSIVDNGEPSYFSPFVAWWDDGQISQTLEVTITPVSNTKWTITKTVPQEWDGLSDLWMDATTTGTLVDNNEWTIFHSVNGTNTGTNWNTVRNATSGTQINNGSPSAILTTAYWKNNVTTAIRFWRGWLAYTLSLGGSATVTAANLQLYFAGISSPARVASVVVCEGTQATNADLVLADWDNFVRTEYSRVAFDGSSTAGYKTFTFNATGIAAVQENGTTLFCLQDSDDFDNQGTGDSVNGTGCSVQFHSGDQANVPILNVTYSIPFHKRTISSTYKLSLTDTKKLSNLYG